MRKSLIIAFTLSVSIGLWLFIIEPSPTTETASSRASDSAAVSGSNRENTSTGNAQLNDNDKTPLAEADNADDKNPPLEAISAELPIDDTQASAAAPDEKSAPNNNEIAASNQDPSPAQTTDQQQRERGLDFVNPNNSIAVAQYQFGKAALSRGEYRRFHTQGAPPDFDEAAYADRPNDYLHQIDARRLWQVAADDSNAPPIRMDSSNHVEAGRGGHTDIRVIVPAKAPVTFYATGMGLFENGFSTITLPADANGLAVARLTAADGATGAINVNIASPLAKDHASFQFFIREPSEGL